MCGHFAISLDEIRAWYRTNKALWMFITPPEKVKMPFDEEKFHGESYAKRCDEYG